MTAHLKVTVIECDQCHKTFIEHTTPYLVVQGLIIQVQRVANATGKPSSYIQTGDLLKSDKHLTFCGRVCLMHYLATVKSGSLINDHAYDYPSKELDETDQAELEADSEYLSDYYD